MRNRSAAYMVAGTITLTVYIAIGLFTGHWGYWS